MSIEGKLEQIWEDSVLKTRLVAKHFWQTLADHLGLKLEEDVSSGFCYGRYNSIVPNKNIGLSCLLGDAQSDYWIWVTYPQPQKKADVEREAHFFGADSASPMMPDSSDPILQCNQDIASTYYLVKFNVRKIKGLVGYLTKLVKG